MIDCHCHLAFAPLIENLDSVLTEAKSEMDFIVTSGLPRDYEKSLEIKKKFEDFVALSLGIHPEDVTAMRESDLEKSIEFIRSNADKIVAVGEIGLDYRLQLNDTQIERCKKIFEQLLDVAEEFDLPVVLHSRKAEQDVFDIVSQRKLAAVIFHHYSGNMSLAKQIVSNGYYISLPTTTANSKTLIKIAKKFPLKNLLTETDAPFNSPEKNVPNVPQNVKFTLRLMEDLRNIEMQKIDKIIVANARKIFRFS
jgi:TatD DNase family protein